MIIELNITDFQYRTNLFGNLVVWVQVKCAYQHPVMMDYSPEFFIWRKAKSKDIPIIANLKK